MTEDLHIALSLKCASYRIILKIAVHPQRLHRKHSVFHEMFKALKLIGINERESVQFGGASAVLPWALPEDMEETHTHTRTNRHFHLYLRQGYWDGLSERPNKYVPLWGLDTPVWFQLHLSKVLSVPFLMDINTQSITPQLTTFYCHIKLFSILAHNSPSSERTKESEREKHLKYLLSTSPSLKHINSHTIISYIRSKAHRIQFTSQIWKLVLILLPVPILLHLLFVLLSSFLLLSSSSDIRAPPFLIYWSLLMPAIKWICAAVVRMVMAYERCDSWATENSRACERKRVLFVCWISICLLPCFFALYNCSACISYSVTSCGKCKTVT